MATKREWVCGKGCEPAIAGALFDALYLLAKGQKRACTACQIPLRLKLKFPFGLNAGFNESTVLGAFTSKKPQCWKGGKHGKLVHFYPFLIVLERHGVGKAIWMPYWHLVEKPNGKTAKKYGQWAPFMDDHLYRDLLRQAKAAGFHWK